MAYPRIYPCCRHGKRRIGFGLDHAIRIAKCPKYRACTDQASNSGHNQAITIRMGPFSTGVEGQIWMDEKYA